MRLPALLIRHPRPAGSARATTRAAARAAVLLAAAAALSLVAARPAAAGEYVMRNCNPPDGGPAVPASSTGPWTGFGAPTGASYDLSCSGGAGDRFGVVGDQLTIATQAGMQLVVPTGSPIELRHVKAWWVVSPSSAGSATTPQVEDDGRVIPSGGGRDVAAPDDLAISGKQLRLESSCGFSALANCSFPSTATPIVGIAGTEVTLAESVAPTATIDGSPLLDGRVQRGVQPLGFTARDADSGVGSVAVQLDGTTVASQSFEADPAACPHTTFAACATQQSGVLAVDTTKVPDGVHRLTLLVADAAGNLATASNVDTIATPARVDVQNGPPADAAPAPSTAKHWVVRLRVSTHRVRNGGSVTFRGTISNRPISAGKLAVVQVRQAGRWRPFATPSASATGTFQVRQRFKQSRGQRLQFRAVVPREKGYPYATGASAAIVVRVV